MATLTNIARHTATLTDKSRATATVTNVSKNGRLGSQTMADLASVTGDRIATLTFDSIFTAVTNIIKH